MMEEFFGKPFRWTLLALVFLFVGTLIAYVFHLEWFLIALIALFTITATFRRTEYGLAIALVELLSNAHGALASVPLFGFSFSLRMAIFCACMLGFLSARILKKNNEKISWRAYLPFFPLLFAILIGTIVGITKRDTLAVFQDMNAYLFLLYLIPISSISWDHLKQRMALQILAAETIFTAASSLILLFFYTHLSESFLRPLYLFLRDIRFAEITNVGFGMFRVFEQTQLFAFVFGLLLLTRLFQTQTKKDRRLTILFLTLIGSTLLLSFSRSFWIGFASACIVLFFYVGGHKLILLIRSDKQNQLLNGIGGGLLSLCFSILLLVVIVRFPWPQQTMKPNVSAFFESRVGRNDAALTSRWKLLLPMVGKIQEAPIFGNGFGSTVTFQTDDPRARAIHPDGSWTTSSMEWGWLELLLKMGLLGPIGFIFLAVSIIARAHSFFHTPKTWIGIWIISSVSFIYATHIFSPYLNHPIGIGTLLLFSIFLPTHSHMNLPVVSLFFKQKILSDVKLQTATCSHDGCPRR